MKNAISQIKKLRGTCKVSNPNVNKVYFINNVIFWTDFTTTYKKEMGFNFNFNGCYSTDLKELNNILKSVKTVENINIDNNDDDILTINQNFKIKLEKEQNFELPENIYNSNFDLLNKRILSNLNIKDLQKFSNASAKFEQYSILKNICIKKDKIAVTDGNRLNILNIETENVENNKDYFLNAYLIDKNINKTVNVYIGGIDNKYISVTDHNNNEIITTLMDDGTYPKYEQLIPQYKNQLKIENKKEFLNALKTIKNLINFRTKIVLLDFNNNKIKGLNDKLLNELYFNFNYNGELEFIAFNVDYLIDALNYMDDSFVIELSDNSNLACSLLKSENKTTLLMPIMIRDIENYNIEKVETETETETETEFKKEISIDSPEAIEMKKEFDKINEKMINSKEEYKELINKESEQIMTKEQINAVTKHIYTGNNAFELEKAGFNSNEWVGSGQAKKLGKQVKKDAKGIVIKVYKENEDGQTFCKLETIYNIEELEEIKKVENTSQFKDMVNRFKNMFVRNKTKKRA